MKLKKPKREIRKKQRQATAARVHAAVLQAAEWANGCQRSNMVWGFMVGLSSLAVGTYHPAFAQEGKTWAQPGQARQYTELSLDGRRHPRVAARQEGIESARRSLTIPAGELQRALLALSQQGHVQLLYPSALVAGLRTEGLDGSYTSEEALQRLLQGTGLRYRFSDVNVVTLYKPEAKDEPNGGSAPTQSQESEPAQSQESEPPVIEAEPIVVEDVKKQSKVFLPPVDGYKADETTGVTRTALPVTETPSSIGVVTRDIIKDTFSLRQSDAFEHVSGVSRNNTRIGRGEGFNIRGFEVGNFSGFRFGALRQNGLAADSIWGMDPALVERYEIIKGPASIAGGSSTPGGVVNRITKTPQDTNFATSQFQAGSFGLYRGVFDANGVMPQNNDVRGRFILAVEEGGNFVDDIDVRQYTIGPSIEMDLFGGAGTLLLTGTFQRFHGSSYPGFPFLENGKVPDIPRTRNFGGGTPNGAETTFDGQNYEAHYVHQFVNNLTLSMKSKYSQSDASEAAIYANTSGGIPLSGDTLIRGALRRNEHETYAGEVFLSKEFEAFKQKHEVLLGVDHRDQTMDFVVGYTDDLGEGVTDNIFDPRNNFHLPSDDVLEDLRMRGGRIRSSAFNPRTIELIQTGVFGQVVARPLSRLTMVGAFRHDWAEVTNTGIGRGLPYSILSADDTAFTGRIGAIYELLPGIRVYGGYSESFQMNVSNKTAGPDPTKFLPPETGQNYEVGAKLDLLNGRVLITTALFRNFRQNVPSWDPVLRYREAIGEQRHQGVEFDVNGQPLPGLNLTGNVSYIDAKVSKDNNASLIGTPPLRAPRGYLGKVFATYALQTGVLQGLGFGGGVFFHSGYELDRGAVQTDPYERVDAIVFYRPPQKTYEFTINVRNLLDATYIENPGGLSGYNSFGAPATVVGTLRMTF